MHDFAPLPVDPVPAFLRSAAYERILNRRRKLIEQMSAPAVPALRGNVDVFGFPTPFISDPALFKIQSDFNRRESTLTHRLILEPQMPKKKSKRTPVRKSRPKKPAITPLVDACKWLRQEQDRMEKQVHGLAFHPDLVPKPLAGFDQGEARANIMLAYRHLEDSRMRLGKVIQARTGGASIYDAAPKAKPRS